MKKYKNIDSYKDIRYILYKYKIKIYPISRKSNASYQNIYNWLNGYNRPLMSIAPELEKIVKSINEKIDNDDDKITIADVYNQYKIKKIK